MINEQNNILLLKIKDYINTYYTTKGKLTFEQTNGGYIVNCDGDIRVKNSEIEFLTNGLFRFGTVRGEFCCYDCPNLVSLKGAPEEVNENFDCSYCKNLTSLEDAPKKVCGSFYCCYGEKLTSLEGAPKKVGGDFWCNNCRGLTSLKGAPEEVGWNFDCSDCPNLKSLEGAPKKVGRDFDCDGCKNLETIKGTPEELGEYKVKYTQEVLEKYINSMSNKDNERLKKTTIAFLKDFAKQGYENAVECIDWLEKQDEQKKQVHFPKFTFSDVLALQCCMETIKKVQEDEELYEKLNLIHSKMYDAYWLGKQGETSPILSNSSNTGKNKPKFDPKTLQAFDKVLVRDSDSENWMIQLFSHIIEGEAGYPYLCINNPYKYCIPCDGNTKHLVGVNDEAPEYYRYWED